MQFSHTGKKWISVIVAIRLVFPDPVTSDGTSNSTNDDDKYVKYFTNIGKYLRTLHSVQFVMKLRSVGYVTWFSFMIEFYCAFCTRGYTCSFLPGEFTRYSQSMCCCHFKTYIIGCIW